MTEAPPPPTPSRPASSARRRLRRCLDWVTLEPALTAATARAREVERERELTRRLGRALRVADGLLDPADGTESQAALAFVLFREAARWALPATGATTSWEEWSAEPSAASPGPAALPRPSASVLGVLGEDTLAFADQSEREQLAQARAVQAWLHSALEALEKTHSELERLRARRAPRLAVAWTAVVALLAALGYFGFWLWRGPNLAAGKPWRTSSTYTVCEPDKHACVGVTTDIFFHTKEDDNPWFEIDLLDVRRVGHVEIVNRQDALGERALPLIVELSTDGKTYWQAAQRVEAFTEWTASFPTREARYVRLRVPRVTFLHLERVSVRR